MREKSITFHASTHHEMTKSSPEPRAYGQSAHRLRAELSRIEIADQIDIGDDLGRSLRVVTW